MILNQEQEATVTVTDADQNINSGEKDDLDVFRTSAINSYSSN